MAMGPHLWFIVRCYLDLTDASTIEIFIEAMGQRPWGAELMVVGNLNTYLAVTEGNRKDEAISVVLAYKWLEDMSGNLLPRRLPWPWDGWNWSMLFQGMEVRSQTN